MKVCLLFEQDDSLNREKYYDWNSIAKDLGLSTICKLAGRDLVWRAGKVLYVQSGDDFLTEGLEKVMRVPLVSKKEIQYRHDILKDCLNNKDFVKEIYDATGDILQKWDKLGRKSKQSSEINSKAGMITNIQVMRLFVDSLTRVKGILNSYVERFHSVGLLSLQKRFVEVYSGGMEKNLNRILEDMSFYTDVSLTPSQSNEEKIRQPQIRIDFGLGDGLKLKDLRLDEFSTLAKDYVKPYGMMARLQNRVTSIRKEGIMLDSDATLIEQSSELEHQAVVYVYQCCMSFLKQFNQFFDQLRFQIGFYRAGMNLIDQMRRFQMDWCLPEVGEKDSLSFENLKEVVMSMEQEKDVIGNSCQEDGKLLFVITGANQGGKSTFLRSVGIAQVLMQCGLPVAAKSFKSGLYPQFFTHFTRREDSAMNSGRLDEELRRMDQILNHLGKDSMILLNESFASTTEIEGSDIEYDIIKALLEEKVKIITVTHLLSFAQKMYLEHKEEENSEVEFLSAERLEDGTRTFHMVKQEPQLTSFGLDLYEQVVEQGN